MVYRPRIVDRELGIRLEATGAVVVEGPKASGKTETARQVAASEVLLDIDTQARMAAGVDPALVLAGPTPRLVDEWQLEPQIWNHIRREVDRRGHPGQFILTGSAVPADDITRHTGAGRITRLRMRPMSLYESGHSHGATSLAAILHSGGWDPDRRAAMVRSDGPGLTVADLAERVTVGGWPGNLRLGAEQSMQAVRDYLDEIRRVDVRRVAGARRDPARVGRVLQALARHVASPAAANTLAKDAGGDDGPIDDETIGGYLTALARLMIIEDQPAWAPHLRSRSLLRSAAKRHFVDPSLAVAAVRATPDRLLKDLNLFGYLFESLVVRDLRVYAQAADAQVLHYRDSTGLEVDAIIEAADGRWAAFEVKLGGTRNIEQAAASLRKFAGRVDTRVSGEPAALGVIVGTGELGYLRDDGVAVIPVAALGP